MESPKLVWAIPSHDGQRQSQRIVQRRKLLRSRWSPIHRTYISLFFDSPFSSKGKRRNEDDGLKLMTDPQDPSFLLFTANSLNRTKKIWVRFKRHHRRNIAKTILFFYGYDTNGRSSERKTSSLLECYPESWLLTAVKSRHWTRREMHSYKAKAKPVSSYIQLSSLAVFSLQSLKMSC